MTKHRPKWLIIKFCIAIIPILVCSITYAQNADSYFTTPERGFVSWQPAPSWEHALLSGNGTMGAMVIGQPHQETIILSEAHLYLPLNRRVTKPIDQASRLPEIRQLLLQGKNQEAAEIPIDQIKKEKFDIGRDPFIPAFDLLVEMPPANISKYQRATDFQTGETKVSWTDANGTFQRRLFVSRPDSVIVLSIKGTTKINCQLNFRNRPVQWEQWQMVNSGVKQMKSAATNTWLTYTCDFKNHFPGWMQGYEGVGRLILNGGTSHVEGNKLLVSDADEVLLLVKIKPTNNTPGSGISNLQQQLSAISDGYDALLSKHVTVHGKLFNACELNLNSNAADRAMYSEELIQKGKKEVTAALIERAFDAGRYNIISCMGTYPPNLQGLWSGTWTAPWSADFTHDGNVQSAIASVLNTNMSPLLDAYFKYHEQNMPLYRQNARSLYGLNGIHVPAHNTTNGIDTDFSDIWCLTFWTGAAGWTASFFYDYYCYTLDENFLKQRAYPFMKETALFYEEFLQKGADGKLIFNPSYSPENNPANNKSQAAINATMDVMICKQLLQNCIKAAAVLHADKEKVTKWRVMINALPNYEVAADGSLREWIWPGVQENPAHRHTSHLYSLFNETDPDLTGDAKLLKAVNKTLDQKLDFRIAEGGGEMAFGLVQLGLVSAHIGEAEKAKKTVDWLASKYWSAGMGSFHNVGELFNTDISGGLPAVIIEMLIYADENSIKLLPALPAEWKAGNLHGALLRGNIVVDELAWTEKGISFTFTPSANRKILLKFPEMVKRITLNGNKLSRKKIKENKFLLQLEKTKKTVVVLSF